MEPPFSRSTPSAPEMVPLLVMLPGPLNTTMPLPSVTPLKTKPEICPCVDHRSPGRGHEGQSACNGAGFLVVDRAGGESSPVPLRSDVDLTEIIDRRAPEIDGSEVLDIEACFRKGPGGRDSPFRSG